MDKERDLSALRARSSQGAIGDGYRLFFSNFKHLFLSSWLLAVAYALAMGALAAFFFQNILPLLFHGTTLSGHVGTLAMGGALFLLFILIAAAFASVGFHALAVHLATGNMPRAAHWYGTLNTAMAGRTVVAALWVAAAAVAAAAVMTGAAKGMKMLSGVNELCGSVTSVVTMAVVALVLLLAALPLVFAVVSGVLGTGRFGWLSPAKGYGRGLRHLGGLCVVALITGIVTLLLTFIGQLPAHVLTAAHLQALASPAADETLGLPQNIGLITFAVFALTGFIQAYIHLSALFPFYYVWTTVEARSKKDTENK